MIHDYCSTVRITKLFIIHKMSLKHILKDQSNKIIYKIVVIITIASLLIKLYNSKSKYEQIYLKETLLSNTYILSGSYSAILYRISNDHQKTPSSNGVYT